MREAMILAVGVPAACLVSIAAGLGLAVALGAELWPW